MTDEQLLDYIVSTVNGTSTLGATAVLDYLAPSGDAASVQQLGGSAFATRYLDGSGIMELPFAVLRRTDSTDTAGRRGAAAELVALGTALEAMQSHTAPVMSIRAEDTPTLTERSEDGATEVWRCSFMLESYRARPGA